jgi:putative Mn2+ efflux pump MntP
VDDIRVPPPETIVADTHRLREIFALAEMAMDGHRMAAKYACHFHGTNQMVVGVSLFGFHLIAPLIGEGATRYAATFVAL